MKTSTLILLVLSFLLSSCEPRDIQHLPDSARQGRNSRGGGSDTRKASLTLYDFASLQHMVDRQLEAVSVLEMYIQAKERNSQELAEELGFEILNGNRHLGLARYGFVENGGQEKISSDDAWNFDNSQWMASGYADRKLILNNEDSTLLHMSEDKKKLVIKKVSDDEYQITYSLMGDISKYVGSDSDLHVFKYESETRVKRESSGEYLVLSSQMTFSNKRSGDAEYFRVMSAGVTDPQTMFRLKISNCPRAEGRLQASYSGRYQGQLEVEFTAQNIRQISGRGGSLVEDLPLCGASLWSIVNLSSFLN